MKPLLILVSAPSGAGKSTLCDRLLQDYPELVYSVSCTTREPRGEEEDGVDYHFLTQERFDELVAQDAFLEHATVHGNSYGTLIQPIRDAFAHKLSVLLDIDVAGAAQVRARLASLPPDDPIRGGFTDIFILPPSLEELRRRLVTRGEDSPETIEKRMKNATGEMARANEYRFKIVNDDLEIAYKELKAAIEFVNGVLGPENTDADGDDAHAHHHHCHSCQ
ncbi:MAG: guanylate kinase [Kiritimatiellae bacterium]|nr:guanylate kinase [Kiritimatiellia bacterium]